MSDAKPGALSKKTITIAAGMGALAAALVSVVIIGQKRAPQAEAPRSAQWMDSGHAIALDDAGHVTGAPALPADDAALLQKALQERRLPLTLKPIMLPNDAKVFAALAPLEEKTSNLPRFAWRKLENATGYRVEVRDASGQVVAASDRVTATEWVAAKPLALASAYTWSVRAETVAGPVEAQPAEKHFTTMTEGDLAAVKEARSHGLHVLTAAVFARLGMRSEAAAELDALNAENANSLLVHELQESLHVPR